MSSPRLAFFRQSGWMVLATLLSGVFMFAVNLVANRMESEEWSVFRALLATYVLMSLPTVGLQVVFTQQTAAVVSDADRRKLAGAVRGMLRVALLAWLGAIGIVFILREPIVAALKISNPAALWFTAALGLSSLWLPILRGLLQGSQQFLELGWVAILDGAGRFCAVAAAVMLGAQAAGAMGGALAGQLVALGAAFWLSRKLWRGPGEPIEWRPWLRRALPLTLSASSILVMTYADVTFVQSTFAGDQTKFYMAAQLIGVALATLTTPLAVVMFPKIVESAARAHRTNALQLALGATASITGLAALACTLLPELPLRILFFRKSELWQSAALVPWFAWALLPLILTNVLVNNLMARGCFRVAPWLAVLAISYVLTLLGLSERLLNMDLFAAFKTVIGTLGGFSFLMLAVVLAFTWKEQKTHQH